MKITMLGTGHAMVTECYNTCFIISDHNRNFLVDGGGGNTILRQIKYAGFHCTDMHEIFITHKHVDHLMGIIWIIRTLSQQMAKGNFSEEIHVYGHEQVITLVQDLLEKLLLKKQLKYIHQYIHFHTVQNHETRRILDRNVTFFDIESTKEKQFGFTMELDNHKKLTCCGDEPFNPCEKQYAENSTWLLHEAFCLYAQADIFSPYEKHHSTVKDACQTAEELGVQNLILYHTEDTNLKNRKQLYTEEGSPYFHGKLYIPDDLEVISLSDKHRTFPRCISF